MFNISYGYMEIVCFDYKEGTDRRPKLLVFDGFTSKKTGKFTYCGINLNKLDPSDKEELLRHIDELVDESPPKRYERSIEILLDHQTVIDSYRNYIAEKVENAVLIEKFET